MKAYRIMTSFWARGEGEEEEKRKKRRGEGYCRTQARRVIRSLFLGERKGRGGRVRREGEGREEPVRGRKGGEEREEKRISFTHSRTGGGGREIGTRSCCAAIRTKRGKGSRREEGLVPGKERNGPVSQWDPVERRPDRAAGKTGHCPDPGLATP